MCRLPLTAALALLSLLAAGCGGLGADEPAPRSPAGSSHEAGDHEERLVHGGSERTFLVHVPPGLEGGEEVPLVLAFHGGLGTGSRMATTTRFSELADTERFIVVYPDGLGKQWNDGRGPGGSDSDDVGFVAALITDLQRRYPLAAGRIFATGVSNGGMLAQRLACEQPATFAAVATVVASLPEAVAADCSPSAPPSALMINGTADPLVPYEGGQVQGLQPGMVIAVPAAAAHWAALHGCDPAPQVQALPETDPADGTTVRLERFGGCAPGRAAELYAIEGGGHGWPGGGQPERFLPGVDTGAQTTELDATRVVWDFFAAHPR